MKYALLAAMLACGSAHAESGNLVLPPGWLCSNLGACGGAPGQTHAKTGDADLDRATAICDAHYREQTNGMTSTVPPTMFYDPGYAKACQTIDSTWQRSDTARREREAKAKAEADKAWLDRYAATLTPK